MAPPSGAHVDLDIATSSSSHPLPRYPHRRGGGARWSRITRKVRKRVGRPRLEEQVFSPSMSRAPDPRMCVTREGVVTSARRWLVKVMGDHAGPYLAFTWLNLFLVARPCVRLRFPTFPLWRRKKGSLLHPFQGGKKVRNTTSCLQQLYCSREFDSGNASHVLWARKQKERDRERRKLLLLLIGRSTT